MSHKVSWIISAVSLKPNNPLLPGALSAILLRIMEPCALTQAIDTMNTWATQRGGQLLKLLDAGLGSPPIDATVLIEDKVFSNSLDDREMVQPSVILDGKDVIKVLWHSPKELHLNNRMPSFVSNMADAIRFLLKNELPVYALESTSSRFMRSQWRNLFLPLSKHNWHLCESCGKKNRSIIEQRFDWEVIRSKGVIEVSEVVPPLVNITKLDQMITIFFEPCDLPWFLLKASSLYAFDFRQQVDMYIVPLRKPQWTIALTHEPTCGPYYIHISNSVSI